MTSRLSDDQLRELTGVLRQTRPEELTCEEWLHHVCCYAEAVASGGPAPPGSELLEHHLALCPECKEEFDVLVALLRAGDG